MHHRLLLYACALLSLPAPLFALTLDLAGTPARVRASNPELKAARLAIDEAKGRLLGAGRLENPVLSFETQGESGLSPARRVSDSTRPFP